MTAVEHVFPERPRLAELRRRVAAMEGRLTPEAQLAPAPAIAATRQGPARLRTGMEAFDRLFAAPGLARGALHEITAAETRQAGALSGFAAALAAQLAERHDGDLLWVVDPQVAREAGVPFADGLAAFGLDPARILLVTPRRIEDCLWALEEGARSSALFAVIGEIHGAPKALDLTATRRLSLKVRASGTTLFLLRHASRDEPTAALTRFCVSPRQSRPAQGGRAGRPGLVGAPAWRVRLEKNRDGRPGEVELEWDHVRRSFTAPADLEPLVSGAFDRPDRAAGGGEVVAFARR
ncbi:inducible mutagenesis protein A [Stappia sp. F7233]|uniref:Inducible mutagenesis protein A n=1 Tax=Stappia albiluteola TaxID=2758565 RepID=A0A839AFC6_9HYPH|nr:inducible mutagenesis protein A [Stappia albiluteola]MBA5778550.1 inducible mutagenesis protein A [Stappia albiluteola]